MTEFHSFLWLSNNPNICFIDYAKPFDCVDHNKLWTILQEMRMPDHLPGPPRNLCAGQEQQLEPDVEQWHWFQVGKGVRQGCVLSPWLFNLRVCESRSVVSDSMHTHRL